MTIIYTKHFDLEAPEALKYNFITNPLAYIGHQNRLLEAKEVAAAAYTIRAT